MLYEAVLCGLVIVGRDKQEGVGAGALGVFRQRHGVGGVVGAAPGDNRDASGDALDAVGDSPQALLVGHGHGFARRAADNHGVDTALNLPVDDTPEGVEVHAAGLERRHNRHARTGENGAFHIESSIPDCLVQIAFRAEQLGQQDAAARRAA